MTKTMKQPRMFYFGPWSEAGHYFFDESGRSIQEEKIPGFPFGHDGARIPVDGCLQPGCQKDRYGRWNHRDTPEVEGEALLHHISSWTVLSFWDRSVDTRGACNSNYFAEGGFTFDQMVEMAKARFAGRWSRMRFDVVEQGRANPPDGGSQPKSKISSC